MPELGVKLFGDWDKAAKALEHVEDRFAKAAEKAILQEAHRLRGHMVQNVTSGGTLAGRPFAPLSPATLIIRKFVGRGGTKPLIVSGALRNSITVVKVAGGVFVGVRRKAEKGVNIAALMEFGGGPWTRPMTAKQRRFLAAAFRAAGQKFGDPPAGGGVLKIKIPARPFMQPVVDKFARPSDVKKRFWEVVAKEMHGDLGRP